jgi:lipoprotein-anchoring transpeptidase ErfK/SrfK
MRKIALAFTAILIAAPAFAQNSIFQPLPASQIQGPSVIRAPRVVEQNDERQPQRNVRRQRNQQWDQDETPPAHYQRQQPVAQYQQQQPQQYYTQERPNNLGGGFIEFLVTGNANPRAQQQQQAQPQGYYHPPQQQQYYQQQQPMHYQRQLPAQQQPMHVARTDPQEQPPRPAFDPRFERTEVEYQTDQPVGTVVIDTRTRYLYLVQPNGRAIRYGVGVGRPGFEWKGVKTVSAMKEWPDWRPPEEMRKRQPWLPEHMAGGPNNPLGARALYLGSSLYRIHGSNEPHTIGGAVSSGCFRMRNQDVIDLYNRVRVGARVVVL